MLTLAIGLLLVGALSAFVHRALATADANRFELIAGDVVDRINDRISTHLALLDGIGALYSAAPQSFDAAGFRAYVRELDLARRYSGVRGAGFAPKVAERNQAAAAGRIARSYGVEARIWPPIRGVGFPVSLLETTDARRPNALGFNLASEDRRRKAMERAADTGRPAATGVVQLFGYEDSTVPGFLIFRPIYAPGPAPATPAERQRQLAGFALSPFSVEEFFRAVLDASQLRFVFVDVFDGPPEDGERLFQSQEGPPAPRHVSTRTVDVAGRTWVLRLESLPAFDNAASAKLTAPLAGLGLLLALAAAAIARQTLAARLTEEQDRIAAERAARDKDLLLQEMKHRIKNALARVQAVARQTARTTANTDEFVSAFEARLSAMSATHDLLTRSRWESADLGELLTAEIEPVLGPVGDTISVEGPPVRLDARQVLALGLTVHELATNAVKYGGVLDEGGGVSVRWRLDTRGRAAMVVLDWIESGRPEAPDPNHRGFGSRLIEASVTRELGGTFERRFEPTGHRCRLTFPRHG